MNKGPAAPCTIAKAYKEPYVNWATKVMLGAKLKDFQFCLLYTSPSPRD